MKSRRSTAEMSLRKARQAEWELGQPTMLGRAHGLGSGTNHSRRSWISVKIHAGGGGGEKGSVRIEGWG